MQSKATTVLQYLAELPPDRRAAIAAVRALILANLDKGYVELVQYGMIGYAVPHALYPAGYHCAPEQPLPFMGLASQKQHMSLYLMCLYGEGAQAKAFRDAWAKTGKKLDMGKSCIRFRAVEDLALDVIADAIRRMPVKKYLEHYAAARHALSQRTTKGPPARRAKPRAAVKKAAR